MTYTLVMVDPVPQAGSLSLLFGPQITTAATQATAVTGQPYLSDLTKGRVVQGLATDGVAQVVIRIPAASVGQQMTVDFAANTCPTPGSPQCIDDYGYLFDPTTFDPTKSGSLFSDSLPQAPVVVNAVSTANGPMAFLAYRAPADFVRLDANSAADLPATQRSVSVTVNGSGSSTKYCISAPACHADSWIYIDSVRMEYFPAARRRFAFCQL